MRVFLMLGLATSMLLATASTQAHTRTPVPKDLATPRTFERKVTMTPAGGTRPSFSSRPSSSFHSSSTPSYHSYSSTPSRSFSFRSSSPSISTRPAATSTPRTYTYRISGVPHTKTYTPAPSGSLAEVHHYHDGGSRGGGLSATDVILLNAALNNNHQNQGTNTSGSTGRFVSDTDNYVSAQADKSDDDLSGWQIFGIVLVVAGIVYGGYRYVTSD